MGAVALRAPAPTWDWDDPVAAGEALANNHRKNRDWAWWGRPENDQNWFIYHTHNRDSTLLAQSNAIIMRKLLATHISRGTIEDQRFNHFLCGWSDALVVKVFTSRGKITKAWEAFCEIMQKLENYPVLNEEHYGEMEIEASMTGIECSAGDTGMLLDRDQLPKDWVSQCYHWFSDNHDNALQSRDDNGAYPDQDVMMECLLALGFRELEEGEEQPELPPRDCPGQMFLPLWETSDEDD
jgi:hypothetical protein